MDPFLIHVNNNNNTNDFEARERERRKDVEQNFLIDVFFCFAHKIIILCTMRVGLKWHGCGPVFFVKAFWPFDNKTMRSTRNSWFR